MMSSDDLDISPIVHFHPYMVGLCLSLLAVEAAVLASLRNPLPSLFDITRPANSCTHHNGVIDIVKTVLPEPFGINQKSTFRLAADETGNMNVIVETRSNGLLKISDQSVFKTKVDGYHTLFFTHYGDAVTNIATIAQTVFFNAIKDPVRYNQGAPQARFASLVCK